MIHAHSIAAYESLPLQEREREVLAVFGDALTSPLTDREVAERLGREIACVRPRITRLIELGVLAEAGSVKDLRTNRTVRTSVRKPTT